MLFIRIPNFERYIYFRLIIFVVYVGLEFELAKKLYGTGLDRHPKLSWKLFRAIECGAVAETVWNESGYGEENESNWFDQNDMV